MKGRAALVAALGLAVASPAAGQGIPTTDTAVLTQALQQVQSLREQISEMQRQYEMMDRQLQAQTRQLEAQTGVRQIADIIQTSYRNGFQVDFGKARQAARLATAVDLGLDGRRAKELDITTNTLAAHHARASAFLKDAQERTNRLTPLAGKVRNTADSKEALDLIARGTAENALLLNEILKLLSLQMYAEAEVRVRDHQELQADIKRAR